ncbi:mechanosensitive ion channel [Dubosiella newyorkensis]|uniref:mechanosensitive ion channel n=1 Tax=Dubosiella newyorkensis TaxID=1862672 RepID=UPI00272AB010|nr:mechanosensitive ion channel [Dubosiella newyorkensis]
MTEKFYEFFNSGFGTALKAILVLILAFVVAAIAKSLIEKLLKHTKLADLKRTDKNGQENTGMKTIELIGKLVQLIVFLLFVPGIFEILGMTQVTAPILALLNTVWGYVPNILFAIIILWIGFYIAKLVRELLVPILNKLEVNRLQKIAGIQVNEQGELSNTLAYIVYVLILIPVIISALSVLNIRAISDPAIAMLSTVFNYIPSILAALIIIVIGWILAKFIGNIITRLIESSGLDAKLAELTGTKNPTFSLSNVTGKTVEVILVIFFIVESFATLHLGVLTSIGTSIIAYMPYALAAFIIFAICVLIGNIVSNVFKKNGHPAVGSMFKYLIYVIGGFMILNQLGIARTLVDSTFILIVAALAVAFAIAFGVGGRDFAKSVLAELQVKIKKEELKAPKPETMDSTTVEGKSKK